MGGFLSVGGSVKKVSGVFGNVDGKTVRAKSLWVNKDGVPTKIFSSEGMLNVLVTYYRGIRIDRTTDLVNFSAVLEDSTLYRRFSDILYIPEDDKFITFGVRNSDTLYPYTSSNGKEWSMGDSRNMSHRISDGVFSRAGDAIYYCSAITSGRVIVSFDRGATWGVVTVDGKMTSATSSSSSYTQSGVYDAQYVNGVYYATSMRRGYGNLLYSSNGLEFSTLESSTLTPSSLAYGNGILAASSNGVVKFCSTENDPIIEGSWVESILPSTNTGDSDNFITFYSGEFYLFTSDNDKSCVLKSVDCASWEKLGDTLWDGKAHTDGSKILRSVKARKLSKETTIFFASGMESSNPLFYSYDMLNWYSVNPGKGDASMAETKSIE